MSDNRFAEVIAVSLRSLSGDAEDCAAARVAIEAARAATLMIRGPYDVTPAQIARTKHARAACREAARKTRKAICTDNDQDRLLAEAISTMWQAVDTSICLRQSIPALAEVEGLPLARLRIFCSRAIQAAQS